LRAICKNGRLVFDAALSRSKRGARAPVV